MTAPPGIARPTQNGITGTRTKAETKRQTAGRVINAMRAAGMTPQGWQVRTVTASLISNGDEPSDEALIRALMSAPWFPRPRIRKWQIGETGWRTHT